MPLEKHVIQLTEEERNVAARRAASLLRDLTRIEDETREQMRLVNEEKRDLRKEADTCARAAATGREEREIEVRHEADNERFQVHTYRVDTSERVNSRPMTEDEARVARQGTLPLRTAGSVSPLRGITRGGQPS